MLAGAAIFRRLQIEYQAYTPNSVMLNYQGNIINQTVAVFLAFVFILTPLTSLGHLSDDLQPCPNCTAADESTCGCCKTASDCQQPSDHNEAQANHKCYCFCFSNLLSILPSLAIQTSLIQQPFYLLEIPISLSPFVQDIFRPPKS